MAPTDVLGPALEKLVELEVFRAGKYKSAMEPFVSLGTTDLV